MIRWLLVGVVVSLSLVVADPVVRRIVTKSLLRKAPLPVHRVRQVKRPATTVTVPPDISYLSGVDDTRHGKKNLIAFALLTRENDKTWGGTKVQYAVYLRNMIRALRTEYPIGNPTTDLLLISLESTSRETVDSLVRKYQLKLITLGEQQRLFVTPDTYTSPTQYRDQWVKLWLWNMTDYDLVLYIDADHYIRKPMAPLFEICKGHAISATIDSTGDINQDRSLGISDLYFNAGLIVLEPSAFHFNRMLHRLKQSSVWHSWAAEQGFFNWYWGKSYNILDSKWNVMHAGNKPDEYLRDASCIHTKIFDEFAENHWLRREYSSIFN